MFGDLKSVRIIVAKGFLFFLSGCLAVGLILAEAGSVKVAILLAIAIWSFCRFHYFAFYVIEHYVDPQFRFAGLGSFVRYLWKRWRR